MTKTTVRNRLERNFALGSVSVLSLIITLWLYRQAGYPAAFDAPILIVQKNKSNGLRARAMWLGTRSISTTRIINR